MMKTHKLFTVIIMLGLLFAPLAAVVQPAKADPVYTCLPSCEEDDGRFMTIAGSDLATLVGINMSFKIASDPNDDAIEISIFDGDGGDTWDFNDRDVIFTLYADPTARGAMAVRVAQWNGYFMRDNQWFTTTFRNVPEAKSTSGYYFYHLRAWVNSSDTAYMNNFKVRTDGYLALLPRPFSYMASNFNAMGIIYRNYPFNLPNTTYNGVFEFHTDVINSLAAFRLWDGDLDYGNFNGSTRDTNDPDTPNTGIPPWSTSTARPEGVAVGFNGSTGNPPDDVDYRLAVRSPSVTYSVSPLDQNPYANNNPSGNLEWEQFSISSVAGETADHHVATRLPAGLYHIRMTGMDMTNLNAWRFPWDIVGVCVRPPEGDPNPCKPVPHPNKIGDYVWRDDNRNGVPDAGEPPIAGVRVELFDSYGFPLLDTSNNPIYRITDANGWYEFDVEPQTRDEYTNEILIPGIYQVLVAASNFAVGGPLYNMTTTIGTNSLTRTVIGTTPVLTYDFGYVPPEPDPNPVKPPPYSYGYLKHHPEIFPSGPYTVGGVSYTNDQALVLLNTPGRRDMTYRLAWQLLAARMNIALNEPSTCITTELATAEAWLVAHPVGTNVLIDSPAWVEILPVFNTLGSYNEGRMCAIRDL